MECLRAEELLSDEIEGSLEEPLLGELRAHLATCHACSELSKGVATVREALATSPLALPPEGLVARVGNAVLRGRPRLRRLTPRLPRSIQAVAALLTLAITGGLLFGAGVLPSTRVARRYWERGAQAEAWVLERKDRMIEDLRLVRTVITMAFEGRLDRMSDRLDDYRKALERQQEQSKGKSGSGDPKVISELGGGSTRKNL